MTRPLSRLATRLRSADRRLDSRLRDRADRRTVVGGDDGGFVLLESIVVIGLITVVMAAFTTFFVGAITSTNHQRALQAATQLANSNVELIRGLPASSLLTGHDASSVATQFNAAPDSVKPSLLSMTQGVDPSTTPPAAGTGTTAKIPTVAVPQGLNNIAYSVNTYLGTCTILTATPGACGVAPGAGTSYLRALVAVTWRDSTCQVPKATCVYMTSTLLSVGNESCSYYFQTKPADLSVTAIPAQMWTVGSTRNVQLMATGVVGTANLSWAVSGTGSLPLGLALSPSGLISGSSTAASPPSGSVTVTVTDACSRTSLPRTITWAVVAPPTISPINQTSPINTALAYPVPNTCPNTPCLFTAVNLPVGLTINSGTGVISGTPTIPGTVTVTVTVTDSDGIPATTSFTWSVVSPASVCVQSISLPQGGFESPVRSAGADTNFLHGNGVTPGLLWNTTAPDNTIEYWHNGGNVQDANGGLPISAQDGDQWAELNANGVGALYQDLSTVPGQVLQWSVYHRARSVGNTTGLDVMQVQIGSSTSQSAQVPTGQATANISDGPLAWVHYTGVYTVPAGQTTTRFQFAAISTSSGNQTVGNFIDNLSLNNNIACLVSPLVDQASTVNTPISPLSIAVDRGTGPFTWSVTNPLLNPLPTGLVLSSDGVISGTPTVVGSYAVVLTFSDATAFAQTVSFNWTVYPKPTISKPANQVDSVGSTVNLTLTKSCSNAPCTYALNNGPPGLTVTSAGVVTGTITGSAQVLNAVTVTITDAAGATVTTSNFTWTVLAAPTITTPVAQTTTVGAAVNLAVASACADSPCTFTLANAPPGLTINANTGVITGSPTLSGTYTAVAVTITDVDGSTATTANFTWTIVSTPTITSPGAQTTTTGAVVSLAVASTCPNSPCTFALTGAPAGLSINSSTGVISGTVTSSPQVFSTVAVRITDRAGLSAVTPVFTWTVFARPTIQAPGIQVYSVGAPINLTLTKTCPNAPCSYVLNNGPAGLTITSAGVVTGTITGSPQLFPNVTVTITDNAGVAVTSGGSLWTVLAAPTIVTPAAQTSSVGSTVTLAVTSTCGNPLCTFTLTNAPPGLSINATTGVITGSPTLTGTYTAVTVAIIDADGSTATTANFTWTVISPPTVTKPPTQTSTVLAALSLTVASTCPNTPCTFTLANAPLGLSINNSGVISGTPLVTGTSTNVSVTITDRTGVTASTGSFTWNIVAAPSVTRPAAQTSTVGASVNLTLTKSCPNTPCSYVLNNGPAGLTVTSAGVVTGTITSAAQVFSNVTVTITDASNVSASSAAFTWTVLARPTVTSPANQLHSVGSPINLTLTKSCPNTPCSYVLNNGPGGLTISSAGVVTGTITGSAQVFSNATITVTDNSGVSANSAVFTWTVLAAPTVTTPTAQTTTTGATVSLTVASTCADSPCTFTLAGAPPGLTINSSGVISGTVTGSAQTYNAVSVTITDVDGSTATTANFTWTVTGPPTITSPGNQTLSTTQSINVALPYTCPNAPCTITTVNFPPGVVIDNQGNVTGTPTTAGTYNPVTITITDASGVRATTPAFTVTVIGPPSAPTSPSATGGSGQIAVSWTAPNNNGSAITSYTATAAPGGATCTTSATACTITGLANGTTYTITVTATNALGTGPPSSAVSATTTASCTTVAVGANAYLAYPFNEAGGLVSTDISGNSRAGTYTSAGVTYGAAGPCPRDGARAVTLNGSTGYISSNVAPVNPQVFSEAIWFKTTVAGGKLIGYGNAKTGLSGQDDRHIYMTNAGTLAFGVYPGATKVIISPLAYNNNVWHQAIATLAPSTDANPGMRLYVDGRLVASDATTTAAEVTSATSYWRIGYDNINGWPSAPSNYFFNGSLAFAATYTYAVTPAQALGQYNAGI